MKLIAIKSFPYAGKRIQAGQPFETKSNKDAKLLIALKRARLDKESRELTITGASDDPVIVKKRRGRPPKAEILPEPQIQEFESSWPDDPMAGENPE